MKRPLLLLITFLSQPAIAGDLTFTGRIVDETTHRPAVGVQVMLLKSVRAWQFWLPTQYQPVARSTSNDAGEFTLSGDVSHIYTLELDSRCWSPFKKSFTLSSNHQVSGFEILVHPVSCGARNP